jgi:hypothetical protein
MSSESDKSQSLGPVVQVAPGLSTTVIPTFNPASLLTFLNIDHRIPDLDHLRIRNPLSRMAASIMSGKDDFGTSLAVTTPSIRSHYPHFTTIHCSIRIIPVFSTQKTSLVLDT